MAYDAGLRNRRFTTAPTTVSLSTSTARTASALTPGVYLLYCATAFSFLMGDSTVNATTSSVPVPASTYFQIEVTRSTNDDNAYVAAILGTGTDTLYIIPQEP